MRALRILSFSLLCLVTGCREAGVSSSTGALVVAPQSVDFGQGWVGVRATQRVQLQNTGKAAVEVRLEPSVPFEAPATALVEGGESVEVELSVTPSTPGVLDGALVLHADTQIFELPLRARAQATPSCPPRDCHLVRFDPASGHCEETVDGDGAACGESNQCLFEGRCVAGTCVGRARACDDADACTTDACAADRGCVHEPVVCPTSARTCEVATCSPATGCGLGPAEDGASCGENDCRNALVCMRGQCVARPSPEGSECAPPTVCQGPGVCRSQQCTRPPATALQPSWRYTAPPDHVVAFLGHVDDEGNLYATETEVRASNAEGDRASPGEGISQAPPALPTTYLLSLRPDGAVRYRVAVANGCSACQFGLSFALDSAGQRLFFSVKGELQARRLADGASMWRVTPSARLPAYNLRPDGGALFSSSPPLLLGDDLVGVPVIEGQDDHHSWVEAFDRATGAHRWSFHRKGHLYGTGATGQGELWTSSANCWAVAGEMARVDAMGVVKAAQFVEWIPSVYGEAEALGTAQGKLHRLDATLRLTDLSALTSGTSALVSGQRLVTYDGNQHTLQVVDLATGARVFSATTAFGAAPDFELLRDGGVGWTTEFTTGGWLGALDASGKPLLACPLATSVDSPTAISRGRAVMAADGDIVSYVAPGLDVEPRGWVSRQGSLARGARAR